MKRVALQDFKMQFAKLVVLLDILVLLVAGIPIAFFLLKGDLRLWTMVICIVTAIPLSLYFARRYRATKNLLKEV